MKKIIRWFINLFKRPLKHIVVCGDVSGSSNHINMVDEVNKILSNYIFNKTTLLLFDNKVNFVEEITKNQKFERRDYKCDGGTDFQSPMDWIEQNLNNDVSLCVIVSDGYAPIPKRSALSEKIVWMIFDNPTFTAPFGKVVFI